jgi:predicted RNA binding protein YcfA (HicA-like mRNA interferase family)
MKLPRDLSGAELIQILCRHFDNRRVNQEGSHVILQAESPRHHRLAVPDLRPLGVGTLNAIVRSVAEAKQIGKEEILAKR